MASGAPATAPAGPPADVPGLLGALRDGDALQGVVACVRKDRLEGRSGPYLAVELRDRSGALPGRAFRDVDRLDAAFDRGDAVRVRGRVARFRDALQVEVAAIERVAATEAELENLLPVALRDREELEGFLEGLAGEVGDARYAALLRGLLADDALRAAWRRAPCSRAGHHAYLGGLLEHTVAVGAMAVELAVHHPGLNRDLLLTACLVHDLGHTRAFTYGAEFGDSPAGELVGHVELGLRVLAEPARAAGLDETRWLHLAHCVLAHHGAQALPGGRFRSAEAAALHRLNALDAGVKDALVHGLGNG